MEKGQRCKQFSPQMLSVSVIIPCWNQARFLADAVESVVRQTYDNTEIIVVDDGSDDETSTVAGSFPAVCCIRQSKTGLAAARNTGLNASRGAYVIFLDADDRLLPNAVEAGLECLSQHPQCAFAAGDYRLIDEGGSPLPATWPRSRADSYAAFLRGQTIDMGSTVIYRRSVFDSVKGFDPSLKACEDYDLYLRITQSYPICCHDAVVAEYRQHNAQMSRRVDLMLKTALSALRSQRKVINGRPEYVTAYEEGIRFWKDTCYGPALCSELVDRLLKGRLDAAAMLVALIRYRPHGLTGRLHRLMLRKWQELTKSTIHLKEI